MRLGTANDPGHNSVRLEPWGDGDLPLLKMLLGDPAMTEHLGGPESDEQLVKRHARYLRTNTQHNRMFKIVVAATGAGVGSVGYWEHEWQGETIYEIGWSVLPAFQGCGIGTRATAQALAIACRDDLARSVHAFPSVDNPPSNAICRKLGFTLVGECDVEYPAGHLMRCNDWRFDLAASSQSAAL